MNITQLSWQTDGLKENTECLSNGEVASKEVFLKIPSVSCDNDNLGGQKGKWTVLNSGEEWDKLNKISFICVTPKSWTYKSGM